MKNIIKILLILLQPFFLSACLFGGSLIGNSQQDGLIIGQSRISERRGTGRTISSKKQNARGNCEDNYDCEDICEDTYGDIDDKDEDEGRIERCIELPYRVVVAFEEIVKVLEDPAYSKLQNIEANDFEEFLKVSLRPWDEYTRDFSASESKKVLTWIASEASITKSITDAYNNYEDVALYRGIERMLNDISGDLDNFKVFAGTDGKGDERAECAAFCDSVINVPISQGKDFYEIADEVSNNNLKTKIIDIMIEEKCGSDSSKYFLHPQFRVSGSTPKALCDSVISVLSVP